MSFDWNNAAKTTITTALGFVPEVGGLLSGLVSIFWPSSGEDVWSEIENQVEQLVDQKIDTLVYQTVQDDLSGLKNALADYLTAVNTGDNANISAQWITTSTLFDAAQPHFQSSGYQVLLLPLFGQFANLELALLRDGVLYGSGWGWNESYLGIVRTKLTTNIGNNIQYSNETYQQGLQSKQSTGTNYAQCEPFRTVNAYVRQMTLGLLDFIQIWPYLDATQYPNPVSIYLDREIYSDPQGTCSDSGAINLPTVPSQPISQITVWGWDRIDAVQVTYPAGGGPGGVTQTARMGDQGGGSNQPPHGGTFNISSNNPVTVAGGASGDILNGLSFTFKDGTGTGLLGNNYPGGDPFSYSYPGEILSRIHINGVSNFYGSADCAVFGFKYEQTQTPNADAVRLLYVTSPSRRPLSDLAAQAVNAVAPDAFAAQASAEGWDSQRQEYWEYLRSLAAKAQAAPQPGTARKKTTAKRSAKKGAAKKAAAKKGAAGKKATKRSAKKGAAKKSARGGRK